MIVTLTTDFGNQDAYVGIMKGVILKIVPQASIVDLTHGIEPRDIVAAARVLSAVWPYFADGTVHCAVVDPGVGGNRRALATAIGGQFFVCPDNGLLTYVLKACEPDCVVSIENERYMLSPVSPTFHGRDVFAPVAASIGLGVPLKEFGPVVNDIVRLEDTSRARDCNTQTCSITSIDRFGNIVTDLASSALDRDHVERITAGCLALEALSRTYSDVPAGSALAYIGSSGYLEIAIRDGNASKSARLSIGDCITVQYLQNSGI